MPRLRWDRDVRVSRPREMRPRRWSDETDMRPTRSKKRLETERLVTGTTTLASISTPSSTAFLTSWRGQLHYDHRINQKRWLFWLLLAAMVYGIASYVLIESENTHNGRNGHNVLEDRLNTCPSYIAAECHYWWCSSRTDSALCSRARARLDSVSVDADGGSTNNQWPRRRKAIASSKPPARASLPVTPANSSTSFEEAARFIRRQLKSLSRQRRVRIYTTHINERVIN